MKIVDKSKVGGGRDRRTKSLHSNLKYRPTLGTILNNSLSLLWDKYLKCWYYSGFQWILAFYMGYIAKNKTNLAISKYYFFLTFLFTISLSILPRNIANWSPLYILKNQFLSEQQWLVHGFNSWSGLVLCRVSELCSTYQEYYTA